MRKRDVENALLEMNMPVSLSGFNYVVSAVLKIDSEGWKDTKITALYAHIGKEFNSTGSRVERSIRHSFEVVRAKGITEVVQKYIGFNNTENANSLRRFHMILKQEEILTPVLKNNEISPCKEELRAKLYEKINVAIEEYISHLLVGNGGK